MVKKKIEELPVVGDEIVFEFTTFDYKHDLVADPYKFNSVKIYHIDKVSTDGQLYYKTVYDQSIESEINNLQKLCAENPCKQNIDELLRAKVRLKATSVKHPYTFKDGNLIHGLGTVNQPLWSGTDNLYVKKIGFGLFEYVLDTSNFKEGNYYVVWSWTLEKGGKELKSQKTFVIYLTPAPAAKVFGFNNQNTTDKYDFLLKKYLPSMYKTKVEPDDVTATVLENLNWCVAREFTYLENMVVNLMECYDGNRCPAEMLQLLGNFYNIKLRGTNRALHRQQVKNAIPLLKSKGTKLGLQTALEQAGIRLKKLTLLWQVRSPYTWIEAFIVNIDNQVLFELSKMPIDDNFKLYLKSQTNEYIELPSTYFSSVDTMETGKKVLIFEGENKSEKIQLLKGDILKVKYNIKEMPKSYNQIEEYIESLPLMDNRNESLQVYPLKNWNVHLIEEDDPLFNVVITERHPFVEPLTYGKIRTTFLFSELVYNMDTFNGSLRDSKEPCHIDRFFLDDCNACQSSKFNIDVEIEELSDERLVEMMEIIKEYSPFHAQVNAVSVCGSVTEFIVMPQEEIEVSVNKNDSISEVMEQEEQITCSMKYADGRIETLKL